jgi:hypothetical protein
VNSTQSSLLDIRDNTNENPTVNGRNYKSYFRRKTTAVRDSRNSKTNNRDDDNNGAKKDDKVINVTILNNVESKEANEDENSLDYGLLTFSAAGEGKDSERDGSKKDESKKTLSDQIAEGKYGLIEKELFSKTPKAPGIISYKTNSETPDDNEKTLGGLSKDEIWLAEDHLLVLKGGIANEKKKNENENDWAPIDDYEAPKRPVKIPLNPRVPPPFPVQLSDNAPLQFIGANQFSLFNPFTNETGLFANVDGHISSKNPSTDGDYQKNITPGLGAFKNSTKNKVHDVIPPPPWLFHNSYKDIDLLKHFPFNLPLPDQALNRTEEFDEDDPSLFYPPPYSFVYKINHTNLAPVGPLVPGIILPPPPDFFSVYDPEEEKKPVKTPLDAYKRIKEIQLKNRLSATTTTTERTRDSTYLPPKSSTSGYIRDFTRKTKPPSTTTVPSTKLFSKAKPISTTTTTQKPSTILHSTASPDILRFKTNHVDTTTLRLHPVYVPTTKLYTTTFSTTTPLPPPPSPSIKQYQKDYGTQAHPIYFEYFDARTTNPFLASQYNNPSTTTSTSSPVQVKTQKKSKHFYPPQFISSTISPANIDTKYLFVTPKPDVFGAIISPSASYSSSTESPEYNTAIPIQKPLILKPVGKYEDEIAAIKQTLDYYKNTSPHGKKTKPQKVKAIYEFSFEASKHGSNKNQDNSNFKPIISYDQKNVFLGGSGDKKPDMKYSHFEELINTNGYFPTTTEQTVKYYRSKQAATLPPKKNIATPSEPSMMIYGQKLLRPQQQQHYYMRPIYKEVVSSPQQSQPQKIVVYPAHDVASPSSNNNNNNGYRINSKNVKYRNQQQIYGPASEVISLLNDTLVNYKQPHRPINPLSENIDASRFPPPPPSYRPQNSPPFFPQQSYPQQPNFYHPPTQYQPPSNVYRPHYQPQAQAYHQQHHHSAFDYPLIPQINPDSVHITFYNKPMEKSDENF